MNNMILDIRTKENKKLGTFCLSERIENSFSADFDEKLKIFIINAVKNGIPLRQEVYDSSKASFILIEKLINETNELFTPALRDFLSNEGYFVEEADPELDEKIKTLISSLPEENEDRNILTQEWPNFTHLEKTLLLSELLTIMPKREGKDTN